MAVDRAHRRRPERAYRLLDAGNGRRLEAFGERIVDRPAPAASDPRRDPEAWLRADLRYERAAGWEGTGQLLEPWTIELEGLRLELRAAASGQVGLFPEHLDALPWLRAQVVAAGRPSVTVLNLFAYTGLATLALAASGASVVHLDAARSAVAWARRNAQLSGLAERPIRWIVDDAASFVAREARRGQRYDGFVLDPPSWGHAASARAWQIDERLGELLAGCAELAAPGGAFCLLSGHTAGLQLRSLRQLLGEAFGRPATAVEARPLQLRAESGATLRLGLCARVTR
jgi:23S rRNA (cytosine1962-C5)-methyltransferase